MNLNEKALSIIKMGSPIAGGVTGTVLTLLTDDPMAQIAASGVGAQLPQVINDFAERFLSTREKVKIGALEAFTIYKIKQNLDKNKTVNKKFTHAENSNPSIIELYEGVILKAKNEFEEKKIEHIANVFANSLFQEKLNPHDANHILHFLSDLSYRKLCILSFYGRKQDFPEVKLLEKPFLWFDNAKFSLETSIISQDVFELREQGILSVGPSNNLLAADKTHLTPSEIQLSPIGQLYYDVLDLNEVEKEDIIPIMKELEYREEYGKSRH